MLTVACLLARLLGWSVGRLVGWLLACLLRERALVQVEACTQGPLTLLIAVRRRRRRAEAAISPAKNASPLLQS
eukprot:12921146-Prorocentrum_lima.AAC.1